VHASRVGFSVDVCDGIVMNYADSL
jgi:hypothetical protein